VLSFALNNQRLPEDVWFGLHLGKLKPSLRRAGVRELIVINVDPLEDGQSTRTWYRERPSTWFDVGINDDFTYDDRKFQGWVTFKRFHNLNQVMDMPSTSLFLEGQLKHLVLKPSISAIYRDMYLGDTDEDVTILVH